ncbi:hypothetical protein BV924_17785 [Pectobacterium odoriferum]|uniref:Uncharacterized protein n=2 Tax=Pectobacterium odoriferum TaxID=78398 RepID=A0ABD6VKW6_9GAMM|nr:hypothetical protein BVY06_17610 [Pectobacterium odoriferum]POE10346.1 hypothetical protein BV924_17785 [Pectobacterium odoriferum]POE24739.1 hypothetical protein BV926_17305 [Pectobacterium odoriferum]POE29566.1 hypothetical protein BV919_17865 [Pectobacterium odoriferum]POE38193.1 hypothetical protein BV920_18195 [Pectobacterium odoriferum]
MKHMENKLFNDTNEMVMATLIAIALLSTLLCFIQYLLSKQNFTKTCELFKDEFKRLPTQVMIYQSGGFFFSFMRDSFFIIALIAKENGYYTRDMHNDEIRFIKNLPSKTTQWIKTKVIITIFSFISYLTAFIFYLTVIRN